MRVATLAYLIVSGFLIGLGISGLPLDKFLMVGLVISLINGYIAYDLFEDSGKGDKPNGKT